MEFTDSPLESFGETLLDIAVPSQLSFKTPLVFRMLKELTKHGSLPWTGSHRAELCLDEALINAMVHGNKLDPGKKVRVTLFADQERWGLIMDDEGEGFSADDIPDPNDPDFIFRDAGRGIMLMDGYLDELRYATKGNRLMMVRHRQTEPEGAEAAAAVAIEEEREEEAEPVVTSQEDGIEIVEVCTPRVSDENVAIVRDAFKAGAVSGKLVLVDLSRVEYISSVGLGALMSIYKQMRAREGHVVLAGMRPAVLDILESAHILPLFQTAADRKAGVAELKKLA